MKMAELSASSGDPDRMPQSVVSDLGLHCLPITLLGVSRLKWVKPGHTNRGLENRMIKAVCRLQIRCLSILNIFLILFYP